MTSRAPFQILVFPFRIDNGSPRYALFKRRDGLYWQGIAGGGENKELPEQAALREAEEEAGLSQGELIRLESSCMIPVIDINGFQWGPNVLVVPEYAFGFKIGDEKIILSDEHIDFGWFEFGAAQELLKWDSNKTGLWELHHRIETSMLS